MFNNPSSALRLTILIPLLFHQNLVQAIASFQFPTIDDFTVNVIDTVVFQWRSDFAQAFLLMWCQNGTTGNNVVLGSSFQVNTSGTYNYILSQDDPEQSAFPVACHGTLQPDAGDGTGGVDTPFGITWTSSPGLKAKTVSLSASTEVLYSATTTSAGSSSQASASTASSSASTASSVSSTTSSASKTTSSVSTTASLTSAGSPSTGSSTASGMIPGSTSNTTASNASNSSNNNIGAIVGGILGGLGLLCIIIFGLLLLRRTRLKDSSQLQRGNSHRRSWWRFHQNTAMQTGGLHEKDATMRISRYEKDGTPVYEKEGDMPVSHEKDGSMPVRYEKEGGLGRFKRGTVVCELSAGTPRL